LVLSTAAWFISHPVTEHLHDKATSMAVTPHPIPISKNYIFGVTFVLMVDVSHYVPKNI